MSVRRYYRSFDILRILLVICCILAAYGLPVFSSDYLTILFNFAPGCLFAVYGYLVLRDDMDYRKRIKRTLKAFLIMFAFYACLVMGYIGVISYLSQSSFVDGLLQLLNKRSIFEFVVMNVWPMQLGSPIWMVQALLYALVLLWVMDKKLGLMKYSLPICIALFLFSFVFGEGAGLWGFDFHGFTYIPGNFVTKALPYMLLGKLIHDQHDRMRANRNSTNSTTKKGKKPSKMIPTAFLVLLLMLGVLLTCVEFIVLVWANKLVYLGHFLGYILMTYALVELFSRIPHSVALRKASKIYKVAYYCYNPVAEVLTTVILVAFADYYILCYYMGVILTALVVLAICVCAAAPDASKSVHTVVKWIKRIFKT